MQYLLKVFDKKTNKKHNSWIFAYTDSIKELFFYNKNKPAFYYPHYVITYYLLFRLTFFVAYFNPIRIEFS